MVLLLKDSQLGPTISALMNMKLVLISFFKFFPFFVLENLVSLVRRQQMKDR